MAKRKPIYPLSEEDLANMHPGSLLGRLKQLQMCEESLDGSDLDVETPGLIQFKNTQSWIQAYSDVKHALEAHGHIPKSNRPRR